MSATKRNSGQGVQRVAKYLLCRDGRYTYRRGIPKDVRHAFGGKSEEWKSLGDISEAKAIRVALVLGERCSEKIRQARQAAGKSPNSDAALFRLSRVPDATEIERSVRDWLVAMEVSKSEQVASFPDAKMMAATGLAHESAEVTRVMRGPSGEAPLSTRWIVEAIIASNDWDVPDDGSLRNLLIDRVARG